MQVVQYQFREVIGEFDLMVKKEASFLDVQRMNGNPTLYALVNPAEENVRVHFHLYHSEQNIPPNTPEKLIVYIGTFQGQGGLYDYHLFRDYGQFNRIDSENKAPAAESSPTDQTPAAA